MTTPYPVRGLWCAMLTPLDRHGNTDYVRFARHAHALLAAGIDGVAPFGTTGEGQSFTLAERLAGADALLAAGIPAERTVAATGCAALQETITLTRHGVESGCPACLVLPPFFWKDVSDDGLFRWYAGLIEGVNDPRLRVYLYHIPQVSGVPLSVDLVARLAAEFPGVIAGVKDSAGDWDNTAALLARVPQLAIMVGHEPHLPRLMRAGGAGTICGVANVYPAVVRALLSPGASAADEAHIATFLDIAFKQPLLAGFKAMIAARTGDDGWLSVRAPLVALDAAAREQLAKMLSDADLPAFGL